MICSDNIASEISALIGADKGLCGGNDLATFIGKARSLLDQQDMDQTHCTCGGPVPFTDADRIQWHVPNGASDAVSAILPTGWGFSGQANFTSVVSSAFVATGRWMYEVVLQTDGIMQLGWSCWPAMISWSSKLGVGDFPFTVAYDGSRQKIWNLCPLPTTGPKWLQGDVVTCLLDLGGGIARFARNGSIVGECSLPSYSKSPLAAKATEVCLSYAPALSLGSYEACSVNLGAAPFMYPFEGYSPIDTFRAVSARRWLARAPLLRLSAMPAGENLALPLLALLAGRCGSDAENIASLAQSVLVSVTDGTAVGGALGIRRAIAKLLDALQVVMSGPDFLLLVECLGADAAQRAAIRRVTGSTETENPYLQVLVGLVAAPKYRNVLVKSTFFLNMFLNAFRVKAVGPMDLCDIFPLPTSREPDEDSKALVEKTRVLHEKVFAIDDAARCELVATLLDSAEGANAVHDVLDRCVRDLRDRPRTTSVPIKRYSDLIIDNVLMCRIFFALVSYLSREFESAAVLAGEDEAALGVRLADLYCPPSLLVGQLVPRLEFPRIGGTLQHVLRIAPIAPEVPAGAGSNSLLAKAAILYSASVKEHVIAACNELALRQRQKEALQRDGGLSGDRREDALTELATTTRSAMWTLATYRMDHNKLANFCSLVVHVIDHYFPSSLFLYFPIIFIEVFVDVWHFARKTSPEYSKLVERHPDIVMFFIDKLLHRNILHPDTSEYILLSLGGVLGSTEAQRMAVVSVLQKYPKRFEQALLLLLKQFGHPLAWTLVVGILAKFNASDAFCMQDGEEEGEQWALVFPLFHNEPEPTMYRAHDFFREALRSYIRDGPWRQQRSTIGPSGKVGTDDGSPSSFLKNLLAHTNWALSELGACLAQTDSVATLTNEILMQRRRCSSVFELTRRLLHMLEFTIAAAGDVFFATGVPAGRAEEPGQERSLLVLDTTSSSGLVSAKDQALMNCAAVVEIWTQTISRFAYSTSHLWRVSELGLPGTDRIKPWKLYAAAVGVLHSMLAGGSSLNPESNPFLAELSQNHATWTMEQVSFLLGGFEWTAIASKCSCADKSSFASNSLVLTALTNAHNAVLRHTKLDDDDSGIVEDGTCAICATNVVDTSFSPCGHSSCGTCIRRHIVTQAKCFFCNKPIDALVDVSAPSPSGATAELLLQH